MDVLNAHIDQFHNAFFSHAYSDSPEERIIASISVACFFFLIEYGSYFLFSGLVRSFFKSRNKV